ncbi:hypothetical protein K2173_025580 [Erythroxylum novogranatense]|uniref:Uncharacterized protein n=1 Tax=Erythroxylum novogranatense TaxID=1862640 RepID=A0AAV8T8W2_9ROSI|nr:hypothetical protein K2173_025580 [Erythroxylum novogranatense]
MQLGEGSTLWEDSIAVSYHWRPPLKPSSSLWKPTGRLFTIGCYSELMSIVESSPKGEGHLCPTGSLASTVHATVEPDPAPPLLSSGARHFANPSIAIPPQEDGHSTPLDRTSITTGDLDSGMTSVSAEARQSETPSFAVVPALPPMSVSDPSGSPVHAVSKLPEPTVSALVTLSSPPNTL